MTSAILAIVLGLTPVAEGKATRYNPGVMDEVVNNRIKWGQLDLTAPHRGYVALADCDYIGETVFLKVPERGLAGPYLVADCGAQHDQRHLQSIDFAVDLSWEVAQELDVIGAPLYGVTVYQINGGKDEGKGLQVLWTRDTRTFSDEPGQERIALYQDRRAQYGLRRCDRASRDPNVQ